MASFHHLDTLLEGFTQKSIPGCACIVMKDGEILHESYAGYSDIEKGLKVNEHSMFRQASTTKLFTYAIAMMLFEEGKFLFTDPIYEYLPEWRHTKKFVPKPNGGFDVVPVEHPITVKDAFTMSCGLPYCMGPIPARSDNPTLNLMSDRMEKLCANGRIPELREEVSAMSEVPILFEPGTHWLYGLGSEIVGVLVETLTGKSVRQNMLERLIEPMGLKDTATLLTPEKYSQLVRLYRVTPEGEKIAAPESADANIMVGGAPEYSRANLNTTARDFTAFMYMLANGGVYKGERYLSSHTIDMMRCNQLNAEQMKDYTANNGIDILGYGYGMGVRTLMDKAPGACNGSIGAFGWSGGYGSWAEASPADHMSVVYMHNTAGTRNEWYHMKVRSVVYGALEF